MREKTIAEIQAAYTFARASAERTQRMVAERARDRFNKAYGMRNTSNFECFHLAHNWRDLPDNTREQRSACRYVLRLRDKQWEAMGIASALYKRMMAGWREAELARESANEVARYYGRLGRGELTVTAAPLWSPVWSVR